MKGQRDMTRKEVEEIIEYWEGLLVLPSRFLNPNVTNHIKLTLRVLRAYLNTLRD